MSNAPLMPKATAVWLVENTSLSFDQIADFCKLHPLEVKGIADGEVAAGIRGLDPITSGQLTREEIARGEKNPSHRLALSVSKVKVPEIKRARNHPELKDAQIMRLVGTTKSTLKAVRERTHWNSAALAPMDPVTLGLCSQIDLDFEVNRAAKDRVPAMEELGQTLQPAEYTTQPYHEPTTTEDVFGKRPPAPAVEAEEDQFDADRVFGRLKNIDFED
jgi:hypothetical protein